MKETSRAKIAINPRLDRAVLHVTDHWFPTNPVTLQNIQKMLSAESGTNDAEQLVKYVKSDASLFCRCVRQLAKMIEKDEITETQADPITQLESLETEKLRELLTTVVSEKSSHTLGSASQLQLSRLGEVMVSATTAEVLSESAGVSSSLAYSAAVLRQLGYALIAWNYPSIYQRCVASLKQGRDLDLEITRALGFSPSALAISLLRRWGVSSELRATISIEELEDYTAEARAVAGTVAGICKIGETLARANNPELYPNAPNEWATACQEIEARLGPEGMRLVQEQLVEVCEGYIASVPHLFRGAQILAPQMLPASSTVINPEHKNRFLSKCAPLVQQGLNDMYRLLSMRGTPQPEPLRYLIKEVVPSAEFVGGLVYTLEPSTSMLVPQLDFGVVSLTPKPLAYDEISAPDSLPTSVFKELTTEVSTRKLPDGSDITAIAGVIGYSQRIGVLDLELKREVYFSRSEQHLIHFSAFIQALNDALFLK